MLEKHREGSITRRKWSIVSDISESSGNTKAMLGVIVDLVIAISGE